MKTRDKVRFLRDPDLGGLEIAMVRRSTHFFPNHAHDYYAIGVMESGGSYCLGQDQEKGLVRPGDIAMINPGQVHSGLPATSVPPSYRMFYVNPDWMRRAARECGLGGENFPCFAMVTIRLPKLHRRLARLSRLAFAGAERLEKQSAMVMAFSGLLDACGVTDPVPAGREHRAVAQAREFLAAHLDGPVSLDDLARAAGLSRYHLLRVFKKATGVSPHAFHTHRRLDRARELLLSGTPIAQAALETGFTDQSHFSRKFKQFMGATPGQYQPRRPIPFADILKQNA